MASEFTLKGLAVTACVAFAKCRMASEFTLKGLAVTACVAFAKCRMPGGVGSGNVSMFSWLWFAFEGFCCVYSCGARLADTG